MHLKCEHHNFKLQKHMIKQKRKNWLPSNGFTVNAAVEPATQPDRNDVQNTASPLPSFFRGPKALRRANRGKYTTEKVTSLNIVAAVPLYNPAMPLVRNS